MDTHISVHADIEKKLFVKSEGLKTFKAAPEKLNPGDKKRIWRDK